MKVIKSCQRLTITTDASFFHQTKVAAFAIWISSDEGKITSSGAFKNDVTSIFEAEFKAILNALHIVVGRVESSPLKLIQINTDNMRCVDLINGVNGVRGHYPKFFKLFRAYKKQLPAGCQLKAKHVKAHVGTDTPRQFVNDWCDKEAKKHARSKHYSLVTV